MKTCLTLGIAIWLAANSVSAQEFSSEEVFNRRILPILRSPDPSSCVQCHLASVDLKNYILPTQEQTFVSLRDQGLLDLNNPTDSKILTLIRMGEKDLDPGARLIHEKTRQAELAAFTSWIKASCANPDLRSLPPLDKQKLARPAVADAVIQHARKSRVMDSFVRNVWSQRMRCFPCHTPHEIDPVNPRHKPALRTRQQFLDRYGEDGLARLGFFRKTPAGTLQHWIDQSKHPASGTLPWLNLAEPTKSLMVLKPTSKAPPKQPDGTFAPPSSVAPVSHMGGLKMHRDDHSYKAFVSWIQDYAHVVQGKYTSVDQLPADNWLPTQRILRLVGTPENWPVGTPLQIFVYRPSSDSDDNDWSTEPLAFTQGTITPRHMMNGALILLKQEDKEITPADLKPGNYLLRVFVDQQGRLEKDPTRMLPTEDLQGEIEIKHAKWQIGFPKAERVMSRNLRGVTGSQ